MDTHRHNSRWRERFPSALFAVAMVVLGVVANLAAPGRADAIPTPRANGEVTATFLDPYDIYRDSEARLESMFAAQAAAGINTVIVQWTGWLYDDGTVGTIYPAGQSTGYGSFDSSLPKVLAAAEKYGIHVWVGLLLRYDLLDAPETRSDATLLNSFGAETVRLARDLYREYGGRIAGWYIPTEPGESSISDPSILRLHTQFFAKITSGLSVIDPSVPVMVSPCVPRATRIGLRGNTFVTFLEPMIRGAGVDVWALQVGHNMTDWPPADDAELIRLGQEIAARYQAEVWADIYLPGPGRNVGDPPDPGFPANSASLVDELDALAAVGVPIAIWTFDDAMNPDPSRGNTQFRTPFYDAYMAYLSG